MYRCIEYGFIYLFSNCTRPTDKYTLFGRERPIDLIKIPQSGDRTRTELCTKYCDIWGARLFGGAIHCCLRRRQPKELIKYKYFILLEVEAKATPTELRKDVYEFRLALLTAFGRLEFKCRNNLENQPKYRKTQVG